MEPKSAASNVVVSASSPNSLRGALAGMLPVALLAALVAVTLLATIVARLLAAPQGFFAEEQVAVIVLVAGLVLAVVTYVAALVVALRRVGQWLRDGATDPANAALLTLALGALVVLLPVLLALLLPQHPAP